MRHRKGVDQDGRHGDEIGGVEEMEILIRIYYMRKNVFSPKH